MSTSSKPDGSSKDSWNPTQYNQFQTERAQPFYDLVNLIEPERRMKVVDLGCGTGELTEELHRSLDADTTLGVDTSSAMLEKAQSFSSERLRFEQGAIESFDPIAQYNLVFSNAALQWCPDHPALFERLRRALLPGGQIAIQMPMNHDYPTHVIARALAQEEPYRSALNETARSSNLLTLEQYSSLVYHLGFERQHASIRVYAHVLESREGVIEWVKGTLLTYYASRLSPEVYACFLAEYRRRLLEALPDEQPFFYPFKRLLLWGRLPQ